MKKRRRRIIVSALILVEVLICVSIVAALALSTSGFSNVRFFYFATTRAEETIEERFARDGLTTLDLTSTDGNVEITASDGDQVVVKAFKRTWGRNQKDAEAKLRDLEVKMTRDGETLRIQVDDPEQSAPIILFVGSTRSSQVDFEISVPRQMPVVAYNRSGAITLSGTQGDTNLNSRYGVSTRISCSGTRSSGRRAPSDPTAARRIQSG